MNNKISLMLCGGGVKGVSYLGFMKALTEAGIEFDVIGSYSGGALAAVFWGLNKDYEEIIKVAEGLSFWNLFEKKILTKRALMSEGVIKSKLTELIGDKTFADLRYKTIIYASNLKEKQLDFFTEGKLVDPLFASMAIAPIFPIARINDVEYVDAGFLTVYPTEIQKTLSESPMVGLITRKEPLTSFKFVQKRMPAVYMSLEKYFIMLEQIERPGFTALTIENDKGNIFSFKNADYYYEEGYRVGKLKAPEILRYLENS